MTQFYPLASKTKFKLESLERGLIASGVTGELISVPEVTGKVYRLKLLFNDNNVASAQTGITLTVDGVDIESESGLNSYEMGTYSAGKFSIADNAGLSGVSSGFANVYGVIECESFSVTKNAGNTIRGIVYAYEVGTYEI